jgi:hypothetical protein
MKKNFLIIICGLLLSLMLIAFFEWLKWRMIPYYIFHNETSHLTTEQIWETGDWGRHLEKYGGSLPKLTWGAFWWHKLLFNLIIVLTTSVFVGILCKNKGNAGTLAVISLIPFFLYSLVQPNPYFLFIGLIVCIPYVFLSYISASFASQKRTGAFHRLRRA